jgi:hypothetical protein
MLKFISGKKILQNTIFNLIFGNKLAIFISVGLIAIIDWWGPWWALV